MRARYPLGYLIVLDFYLPKHSTAFTCRHTEHSSILLSTTQACKASCVQARSNLIHVAPKREILALGIERLAKWTDRYDVIQGSRLDFDGGAFFWQHQLILSLGIPNPVAKWDLGPEGYRTMNQLCFEGGLFSRRVVDKIGLPDARFFIYGDDACYGYVASQHFPAAVVADVVLKRARAVSNWDIAGKRQLNSTSDTNRYYIMRNRGFLARYMQIYGDYHPVLFRLGNAATFCKEFIRLAAVDKCFKTGIPALRRGMKDARKIIKDPNWKPMPPMKDAE